MLFILLDLITSLWQGLREYPLCTREDQIGSVTSPRPHSTDWHTWSHYPEIMKPRNNNVSSLGTSKDRRTPRKWGTKYSRLWRQVGHVILTPRGDALCPWLRASGVCGILCLNWMLWGGPSPPTFPRRAIPKSPPFSPTRPHELVGFSGTLESCHLWSNMLWLPCLSLPPYRLQYKTQFLIACHH